MESGNSCREVISSSQRISLSRSRAGRNNEHYYNHSSSVCCVFKAKKDFILILPESLKIVIQMVPNLQLPIFSS